MAGGKRKANAGDRYPPVRLDNPRRVFLVGAIAAGLAVVSPRAVAGTVTFAYDELGRLLTATYSDGMVITYSYDAAGNRSQMVAQVPDVTPAAVDWANISGSSGATNGAQTISGINQAITLTITYTGSGTIQYSKNSGTYTTISNNGTVSMSASDTLAFKATVGSGSASGTVTVTNTSDGSATLDTFTYSVSSSPDVTPNAVDWDDIEATGDPAEGSNTNVTIGGINTAITLRVENSGGFSSPRFLYYIKNNGSAVRLTNTAKTVSVSSGDTLRFYVTASSSMSGDHMTVYNDSDGGAQLDTINWSTNIGDQ